MTANDTISARFEFATESLFAVESVAASEGTRLRSACRGGLAFHSSVLAADRRCREPKIRFNQCYGETDDYELNHDVACLTSKTRIAEHWSRNSVFKRSAKQLHFVAKPFAPKCPTALTCCELDLTSAIQPKLTPRLRQDHIQSSRQLGGELRSNLSFY